MYNMPYGNTDKEVGLSFLNPIISKDVVKHEIRR